MAIILPLTYVLRNHISSELHVDLTCHDKLCCGIVSTTRRSRGNKACHKTVGQCHEPLNVWANIHFCWDRFLMYIFL